MGVLNNFYVAFDNQMAVYHPGQMVRGNIVTDVIEAFPIRGVRIEFFGKAYLHWSEGSNKHRQHYSAKEIYFNHEVLVHGILPRDGSKEEELTVGVHTFPFQYQLPAILPSSFEGDIGYVRYSVKAVIDRMWRIDPTTKRPFTIITQLDLNAIPDAMQSVQGYGQKFLCCCCCRSGPITASFNIPRKGYVPGDAISLYAEIENLTNRNMSKLYIEILQYVHYHATRKTRTIVKQVAVVTRPGIRPQGSDQWHGEKLVIPPIPPSFLHGCSIMDIDYVVRLNVDPAGPAFDLEVPLPIVVGSIPHQAAFQQQQLAGLQAPLQLPPDPAMPSGADLYGPYTPGAPLAPPPPFSSIPNLPPPTYSESVFGKSSFLDEEDSGVQGETTYAPRYTYYNWN